MHRVCCVWMLCTIFLPVSQAVFRIDAHYYLSDCEASTNLVCNQTIGRPPSPTDHCAMFDGSDYIKIVETIPGCVLDALIADEAMDECGYLGRFPPTVNQCYGTEGWRFYEMKCSTKADNETNPASNSTLPRPDQTRDPATNLGNPGAPSAHKSEKQLDTANRIALGVGLGIGIPTMLLTVIVGVIKYHRSYSISLFLPRVGRRLVTALP